MTPRRTRSLARRLAAVAIVGAAVAVVVSACTSGSTTSEPTPKETPTPTPTTIQAESNQTLYAGGLYVQTDSLAARAAVTLRDKGDDTAATAAEEIAKTSTAMWLGDQYSVAEVKKVVAKNVAAAEKAGTTPVFVLYAIPNRDCGDYSAGGWSEKEYPVWTQAVADTLEGHRAVVMVEPDSLAMLTNCPDETERRLPLVKQAVEQLAAAKVPAYLDAGNSHWVQPSVIAERLEKAGIADARGFFTNVASFYPVDDERAFAEKVSALTGDSHYVIDVSRNGQGWKGTWCNPSGVGLGQAPHVTYGTTGLDALLWIKTPGISDGSCNGGPKAGVWFSSYAERLVALRRS
ncbi:endoglucanase [Frondihabitans sp. PhB188]|uniref:glycoside hydrolase family 6 protein n=1 Tax=Frondihabitans sp. PhB188 TaxID=2485200 RepID=UPI000F9435CA|nr:glycoside hydrolase family 6 protein [Frondihabitans sp. PhB188]ROQ40080.1 endoglucanase [Frondihabitans sp. PhB188]